MKLPAIPSLIVGGVVAIVITGAVMVYRAESRTNKISLVQSPQPVGVVAAKASTYRASRSYAGTFQAWNVAGVGPQHISAYVDTVLVRPGAKVKKDEVLGTLDCRNASALSQAVAMRARAVSTREKAVASEVARIQKLQDGSFISQNDIDLALARAAQERAQVEMEKANVAATNVEVDDCILHAPFAGEISNRFMDPGWFARPGTPVVEIVDRSVVRLTADAPETDFDVVAPNQRVRVKVLATGSDVEGVVARREPATDEETRTFRFEVDVADPDATIPSNTTGEVHIDVGEPVPATELPLHAASVVGEKATIFVATNGVAHRVTVPVKGEIGGSLFVDTSLAAGSQIITSGRALLQEGDRVDAKGEP